MFRLLARGKFPLAKTMYNSSAYIHTIHDIVFYGVTYDTHQEDMNWLCFHVRAKYFQPPKDREKYEQ